ncbi:hypothetical protein [Taibaiella koreensis]|uniref:hypothetical protein n=1 Tax=Taibaiella koreensis TaxID=1268548 RepID=UPI000E59EC9A|nr:hypothetical protein [Taibaiella koreensis]
MNADDEYKEPGGEEERFSDDPEEQLRIENELLRLKLQAETGADIHRLEDVPPEVENAFLNNILAFERQLDSVAEVSIYKILGEPKDFKDAAVLNDEQIEKELERLETFMRDKNIEVDYGDSYPARLKYKFITEELFLHETQQFDIPEMVNHFIYEEFHPNHRLTIEGIAEDFLEMWLDRHVDEESFILADEFVSDNNVVYTKEQFIAHIRNIFASYLSFENGGYKITNIVFDLGADGAPQGPGYAEGMIRYDATLESKETETIEGPFKIVMAWVNGYWEITNAIMPGLSR